MEDSPFRYQRDIDNNNIDFQKLGVSHHYHGPFTGQDEETSAPLKNVFDDPNTVFEADFEVVSIIIGSGSISLLSSSLELLDEWEQRHYDKGKGTASRIQDSDSFLGLSLSTRVSTDDLRAGFNSYRGSNGTLAASDGRVVNYSGDVGRNSGSGSCGGGGYSHGSGPGMGSGSITAVAAPAPEKCDRSTPTRVHTAVSDLDRQREGEQNEFLLKTIKRMKAQYAEQYRHLHEDLANL